MRAMNEGDKAFFYHSNCKEPGIVGIMEVVKEFSEDSTSLPPYVFPTSPLSIPLARPPLAEHVPKHTLQRAPAAPARPTTTPPPQRTSRNGASCTSSSSRSSPSPST
ncbi:EVE domain-containing protein [Candidatus Bathyarchaeota archaeon]|nr:EVE domain-containing protein [Candidatus Bathyarchaeota archaeon]